MTDSDVSSLYPRLRELSELFEGFSFASLKLLDLLRGKNESALPSRTWGSGVEMRNCIGVILDGTNDTCGLKG